MRAELREAKIVYARVTRPHVRDEQGRRRSPPHHGDGALRSVAGVRRSVVPITGLSEADANAIREAVARSRA
jgi:hypothetical protein